MRGADCRELHPGLAGSLLLLLVASLAWPGSARAQAPADAEPERELRVGIKRAPPFAIQNPDGSWSGIAVDLWTSVATSLGRRFVFEERELETLFSSLERGELDVGIGALTVTREREERVDFSHPFHSSGLGIAVPVASETAWSRVLLRVFSSDFLKALAALLIVLALAGAAMWLFERRRNPDEFGGSALRGLGEGFWWSAVTMTTVGYGDRAPRTVPGRLVALVWMFASVITISGFTAAIASTLTVGQLESAIRGPQDLARFEVGSIDATTGASYLERRDVRTRTYPDIRTALAALARGEVAAVVHDAPILRYWVRSELEGAVRVLPQVFDPQQYALALPPRSPLREAITRAVLEATQRDSWRRSLALYLGE